MVAVPLALDFVDLVAAAVEPWRAEEQHPQGLVAPVADGPEADVLYQVLGTLAGVAAPHLDVDPDRVNYIYGKALEYVADRGPLGWHRDTDAVGLDRGVALGLVEPWQAAEMRGRLISCSVQLSAPADYEGGRLLVRAGDGTETTAPTDLATAVFFRSDTEHMVTEVTDGRRASLVVFMGHSPRGDQLPTQAG